jgi:hypothetical protein
MIAAFTHQVSGEPGAVQRSLAAEMDDQQAHTLVASPNCCKWLRAVKATA